MPLEPKRTNSETLTHTIVCLKSHEASSSTDTAGCRTPEMLMTLAVLLSLLPVLFCCNVHAALLQTHPQPLSPIPLNPDP